MATNCEVLQIAPVNGLRLPINVSRVTPSALNLYAPSRQGCLDYVREVFQRAYDQSIVLIDRDHDSYGLGEIPINMFRVGRDIHFEIAGNGSLRFYLWTRKYNKPLQSLKEMLPISNQFYAGKIERLLDYLQRFPPYASDNVLLDGLPEDPDLVQRDQEDVYQEV